MAAEELSGLAKEIHAAAAAGESDEWELTNYTEAQCEALVRAAFAVPVPTLRGEMVCARFIVGGGKGTRGKFSDDLPKHLTGALRAIGFADDRGAATTLASAGCFKFQHDTGRNIKVVCVYPNVVAVPGTVPGEGEDEEDDEYTVAIDEESPIYLCCMSGLGTFQEMVADKCKGWSQKRRLLSALKRTGAMLEECERKMVSMEELSEGERLMYDTYDKDLIASKVQWLGGAIKGMVAAGQLSEVEREEVLDGMRERLEALGKEESEKAVAAREALQKKRSAVAAASPFLVPVPRAGELKAVWQAANRIRNQTAHKGGLMSPEAAMELSTLEERERLLVEECRGWLETDDELEARLAPLRPRVGGGGKTKGKGGGKKKGGSGSGGGGAGGSRARRSRGGAGGRSGPDADGWETVGR